MWALIPGGRLFEGGRLLFSQHFNQARSFLENNKTRVTSLFGFNKTKLRAKANASHKQYKSSVMLLLLQAGLVQKRFFVGTGWGGRVFGPSGWALI